MKKTLSIILSLFSYLFAMSQLQTEQRIVLYPPEGEHQSVQINPNESFEQEVTFVNKEYPVKRFLRVVGGVKMPGKFADRGEHYFREQEYYIDDNLDSINIHKDKYSLYFKGYYDPYERHAYNRITGININDESVDVEIAYKRKKLKIGANGDFGIELQIYYRKEGRHPDDIYDSPDSIVYIPLPEGSGNFKLLKKNFKLPAKTATILIRVGGTNFSGECWLEAPHILSGGYNIFASPFIQHEKKKNNHNYWVGINMATRSWPRWKLEFEGKTVYEGNVFDRASNIADFHIKLPDKIEGKGKLKLTLEKEQHRVAYPYELKSMQLLEESARDFEIVAD